MILRLAHKDIKLIDIWLKYLYPDLVRFSLTNDIGIEWKNDIIKIPEEKTELLLNLLEKKLKELLDECYKEPSQRQRTKHSSQFIKLNFNEKKYVLNYATDIVGIVAYGLNTLITEIRMEKYIDKWIYFELFYYKDEFQEINNLQFVYPDNIEYIKNNWTNTFYHCIGTEGEYLVVKSKEIILKIKPNIIKEFLPSPKFSWRDLVYVKDKPNIQLVINDFFWHHKNKEFLYYLEFDKKKKRYREEDLIKSFEQE